MSEYSAEEVRDAAGRTIGLVSAMLTAFAERIKADQSAAPFGYAYRYADGIKVGGDGRERNGMRPTEAIPLFTRPPAQPAQLWEMKQRACRAHALCNELRLAHPEIPELGDDGVLHEAIHDILRVDTPTAAPAQAAQVDVAAALAHFTDYFVRNYPGPNTIIYDPKWHAPKIFRAAQYAIANATSNATTTPPAAEPVAQGEAEASDIDATALQAAQEIALMWGLDRSQFVAKIQVRIIDVLRRCLAAQPRALPAERVVDDDCVYQCSNEQCRAVHAIDPQGHCPACVSNDGRGWSTIPRKFFGFAGDLEPTPQQIEAGAKRLVSWEDDSVWPDSWSPLQIAAARNEAERVWRSMVLAAAPQPGESNNKPADCSGDPSSCPDNEGRGCYCSDLRRAGESA